MRWEVLAAINEIETDYGRNLNVSSAGALGWMQFMPATLGRLRRRRQPGRPEGPVQPGRRDLRRRALPEAAGADTDLRAAIFAYNHADWYVDSVILRARYIGGLPADLVGSLSGLTQGRFPVQAKATYAKEVRRKDSRPPRTARTRPTSSSRASDRKGIKIFAKPGAPVVAVNDGRIVRTGHSRRLGNFVTLQDVYGNTYTYGHLKSVVRVLPDAQAAGRRPTRTSGASCSCRRATPRPTRPASQTTEAEARARRGRARRARSGAAKERRAATGDGRAAPRSACSPTRTARTRRPPAARSRPTSSPRTSAATSTASSASTAPTST